MNNSKQVAETKPEDCGDTKDLKKSTEDLENLGLDADHSSEEYALYNHDNDRISHNADGEDDDQDTNQEKGASPLMDK